MYQGFSYTAIHSIKKLWIGITIAAIVTGLGLQLRGAWTDGPTLDEQIHLAAGMADWQWSKFSYNPEHPPLTKLLAGGAVLLWTDIRLAPHVAPERSLEQIYQPGNIAQAREVFLIGRLPTILFWLAGIILLWRWLAKLFNEMISSVGTVALVFDPTFLGHGHLITNDVPVAVAVLACVVTLWRYVALPIRKRLWLVGLTFGIAANIKFSGLLLLLIVPCLVIIITWWKQAIKKTLGPVMLAMLIGFILVTWFTYNLPGFISQTAPASSSLLGPFNQYAFGIFTLLDHLHTGHLFYFFGQARQSAHWSYFPVALLAKFSIPALVMLAAAALSLRLPNRITRVPMAWIGIPAVLTLLAGMISNLNLGLRHIMPAIPFLYGLISCGLAQLYANYRRLTLGASVFLLIFAPGLTIAAWPNTISYFNALAGGTEHGYKYLNGADLDWGQDSWRVFDWLQEHHVVSYSLNIATPMPYSVFSGSTTLAKDIPLPYEPQPRGYILISEKILARPTPVMQSYRKQTPIDRIGSTILVYRAQN